MSELTKNEIELIQIISEMGPAAASIIHDQYSADTLHDTMKDIGYLNNKGYISQRYRQYSVTEKGLTVLASTAIEQKLPEQSTEKVLDNFENDLAIALDGLEKKLALEPVVLSPVQNYELKCSVIDRLSALLDPSIASVLEDIKSDVSELYKAA